MMHARIKATREGLEGQRTATGYIIDKFVPFVALPDTSALHRVVCVKNEVNGLSCLAVVLDVGPWNEHDSPYVQGGARPAAESGIDERGRQTNHAGIDLGGYVWENLNMKDNGFVTWFFVDENLLDNLSPAS